ncbi:hypothetical protein MT418_008238 [Batrachochytrium dendrobatidis]
MSDSSIQPSSLIKPSTDSTSTLVIPTPAFPSFNSFPAQFLPALQDVTTSAWVEPTAKTYSTLSSDSDTHSFKQLKKSKKRSHKHKSSKSKKHHKRDLDHHDDPPPFYIDKKGCLDNILYEGVRNSDIPLYKRVRVELLGATDHRWRVISRGVMGQARLIRLESKGNRLITSDMTNPERYKVFKSMLRLNPERVLAPKRIHAVSDFNHASKHALDFIKLQDDNQMENVDQDSQLDLKVFEQDLAFQSKSKEADQLIRRNVKNPDAWLAFVKIQDDLLVNVSNQKRGAMQRVITEKKMSIIDKALKSLPRDERILSAYMDCIMQLHDVENVLSKWDDIIQENPDSFMLWIKYLDFRQTHYAQFSVSQSLEAFQECLETLQENDQDISLESETNLLHVFTRACALLSQSGNTERSIATFQAMIEFSCYCPAAFHGQTFKQRLDLFESFWESECARFGEPSAKGWEKSLFNVDETPSFKYTDKTVSDLALEEGQEDSYEHWAARELCHQQLEWFPLRGADAELADDPFRTVLFEDIRGLMFDIKHPETKRCLVSNFLKLLGASFHTPQTSQSLPSKDQFLNDEIGNLAGSTLFIVLPDSAVDDGEMGHQSKRSLAFPVRSFPLSMWTLVSDGKSWLSNFTSDDADLIDFLGIGKRSMIGIIIQQSHLLFKDDPWLLPMLLSIEASSHPKRVEKMAKTLLKTDRMNLGLWNAYAQVLERRGKIDEARQVYLTALASYPSFPSEHQSMVTSVYTLLANLEAMQNQYVAAMNVLVALAERKPLANDYATQPPAPTRLLKVNKHFEQTIDRLLECIDQTIYNFDMQHLIDVVYAFTMLEYISHGIDASNHCFKTLIDKCRQALVQFHSRYTTLKTDTHSTSTSFSLGSSSLLIEYMYELWTRLLYVHTVSGHAFKPALLRNVLEEALEIYPTNTLFLTVYGWNEAKTGIENRVRRFLSELHTKSPSHLIVIFSIWSEMHQRGTINTHVVRSLFEKAIESATSMHSVSIWYMAIAFEAKIDTTQRLDRAKALFYRGVRECPWAKELYMMAFTTLSSAFTRQEQEQVYALMEEKEIRIRRVAENI